MTKKYSLPNLNPISQWEQEFLEKSFHVFDHKRLTSASASELDISKFYAKIGEFQME